MPALEAQARLQGSQGLQVVAVNYREAEPTVRRFVDTTGLQLPVVRDPDGALAQRLGVHIFPSTLAIDRRGRARFLVVGEYDWASAAATDWIAALLAEPR